ncbi:MAG TPA: hypothetical protein VI875_03040 [Candidatus Norongarragalinales archaeon]|nr:hypothetical protein [Candidatus Norongarragalinales archaeon]
MSSGIVDKSIDLDELLKRESEKGGQDASMRQRLSDAYALLFNSLQDLRDLKAKGDFGALRQAKKEVYDSAMKCKIAADELKEFLDFLGEAGAAEKPKQDGEKRRRYQR